jgi:hypothetical protein
MIAGSPVRAARPSPRDADARSCFGLGAGGMARRVAETAK